MNKKQLTSIFLSALVVVWAVHYTTNHIHLGSIQGHTVPAKQGPSALVRSLRPSYPYSVIAGGAFSRDELEYANRRDSVVRAHYADFNLKNARMVALTDDRYQYVSYRIKEQVYWTKRKLRIPRGELLLSDGQSFARARCGNRLSDQPHSAQTSSHEPDSALLLLPPISPEMLPDLALAKEPALGGIASEPGQPVARSGAFPPVDVITPSSAGQPVVPVEPLWGGAPFAGGPIGGSVVAGSPLIGSLGTPTSPANSTLPQTPTTPVTITGPPPDVTPVPEPSSIYLFLVTLGISIWVLLRMVPKGGEDK